MPKYTDLCDRFGHCKNRVSGGRLSSYRWSRWHAQEVLLLWTVTDLSSDLGSSTYLLYYILNFIFFSVKWAKMLCYSKDCID